MWKRLLVGLDGSEWSESAASYALSLAKRYDAEVEAVYVSDVRLAAPPLPPADMLGAPLDVPLVPFVEIEREDRARGDAVLRAFAERARAAGARASVVLESGVPARTLLARLRGADAVFIGRAGRGATAELGSTAREVGWQAVRPVFVAPKEVREPSSILVAYDGSPEALRAVRVATEISDRGKAGFRYVLLTVDPDLKAAEAIQREAATFLKAHGIEARSVVRAGPPSQTILAVVKELGCDLVVAGSFGHSRLREIFIGSVTNDLLRRCDVPLLIHH
jgi:nucleotide-binding universal stress UspA family protein